MTTGFVDSPFKPQKSFYFSYSDIIYYPQPSIELEQLATPIISIIQNTENDEKVKISYNAIANAVNYRIYANGVLIATTQNLTIDYEFNKNGIYDIYVRCYASGFKASNKSNLVTITVTNIGVFLAMGIKKLLANMKNILIKQ